MQILFHAFQAGVSDIGPIEKADEVEKTEPWDQPQIQLPEQCSLLSQFSDQVRGAPALDRTLIIPLWLFPPSSIQHLDLASYRHGLEPRRRTSSPPSPFAHRSSWWILVTLFALIRLVDVVRNERCGAKRWMLCKRIVGEENNGEEGAFAPRIRPACPRIPRPAVSHSIANPLRWCTSAETGLAIGFVANITARGETKQHIAAPSRVSHVSPLASSVHSAQLHRSD